MYIIKKLSPLKNSLLKKYRLKQYTKKAHGIWQDVIERTGREVVTKKVMEEIKEYSNEMFSSPSLWPWLALYTEIKGEFIPGWLPNDYFQIHLLDEWNPRQFAEISDMKSFYHDQFAEFTVDPLIMKVSGNYYDSQWSVLTEDQVMELLVSYGKEIIIKKDGGISGKGIRIIMPDNLKIKTLNDYEENIVIQPIVKQQEILSGIHHQSLNTLRIATFIGNDGIAVLKFIILKFGIADCRLSNLNTGGGMAFLNIDGTVISDIIDGIGIVIGQKHPDSNITLKGLKVPSVKEAVEKCIAHHNKFPYTRFIAWDIYVDQNSKPKLIEWNAIRPGMWVAEAHVGPLWNLDSILNGR